MRSHSGPIYARAGGGGRLAAVDRVPIDHLLQAAAGPVRHAPAGAFAARCGHPLRIERGPGMWVSVLEGNHGMDKVQLGSQALV
jgi:hypothetical protein